MITSRRTFLALLLSAGAALAQDVPSPPPTAPPANGAGPGLPWEASIAAGHNARVNLSTGNVYHEIPIAHYSGRGTGPKLGFGVFHNSLAVAKPGDQSGGAMLGPGWSAAWASLLTQLSPDVVRIDLDAGLEVHFVRINGTWQAPAGIDLELEHTPGSGWTLRGQDGTEDSYDINGRLVASTDANGKTLTVTYALDRIVQLTDATGRSMTLAHANGRLDTLTDSVTQLVWSFGYDAQGRLASITDPNATTQSITYDGAGRIDVYTNRDGEAWDYDYDANGRVDKFVDPASIGTQESFATTYPGGATQVVVTDRRGNLWTHLFDVAGRQTGFTTPAGNTHLYTYNDRNDITKEVDPAGFEWLATYDAEGHQTSSTDPLGNYVTLTYDAFGNRTQRTDAAGQTVEYRYEDPFNPHLMTSVIQPPDGLLNGPSVTTMTYYSPTESTLLAGELKTVTGPDGVETRYQYDAYGQLNRIEEGPVGWPGTVIRDVDIADYGHRFESTYLGTGAPAFTGFPTRPALPAGLGSLTRTGNVTPGPLGILSADTATIDPQIQSEPLDDRTRSYSHDAFGRMTTFATTTNEANGQSITRSFTSTSNDALGLHTLTQPDGIQEFAQESSEQLLSAIARTDGLSASFDYNSRRMLEKVTYANGATTDVTYYANRLVHEIHHKDDSGATLLHLTYVYDARYLPLQVTEVDENGATSTTTYGYDTRGQLIAEDRVGTSAYTRDYYYDNAANRIASYDQANGTWTIHHYDVHAVSDGFAANHYGSANNRLMWSERQFAGGSDFTFYAYENPHGHVSDVLRQGASLGDTVELTRLLYGTSGSLWLVVDESWSASQGTSSSVRSNVTELRQEGLLQRYLVRQRDPNTLAPIASTFSDRRLAQIESDYSLDTGQVQLLASYLRGWMHVDGPSQTIHAWHGDALGNVRMTSDGTAAASGSTVYTGFGEVVGGSTLPSRYGFQGQVEGETGLAGSSLAQNWVRTGARYYDPETGRYLMRDPLGMHGGLNVYAYCRNQVTACTDPLGLQQTEAQSGGQPANADPQGTPAQAETSGAGGDANELEKLRKEMEKLREAIEQLQQQVNELQQAVESATAQPKPAPKKPSFRVGLKATIRVPMEEDILPCYEDMMWNSFHCWCGAGCLNPW